jgi:hypothetical protein
LLLLLVPRTDDEKDTRRETSFENTDQDAQCDEVLVVVNKSHTASESTPDDHDGGKVDGRLDADQEHIGWGLEDDICDEEHNQTDGVLIRSELEVGGHAGNLCVADARVVLAATTRGIVVDILLCAVHVRQQVHEPDGWQQEEVNLLDKLLLFLGCP